MVISIDAEKTFDKIQNPFMTKILTNTGTKETFLNVKVIYHKHTARIILNSEKLKAFPLILGAKKITHSHHCYSV